MAPGNLARTLNTETMLRNHLCERIQAQISVARTLCILHPEQAKAWAAPIERAESIMAAAAPVGTADLHAAVHQAEEALAPLASTARSYTLYCVGHAHIDMNWQWSWPETVAVTHDSFATVLKLMGEFPDFRFSQSQASVYRIMEQHNPTMLEAIAERVREGRWEVTASHWVEGDKNIVSGESLTRHLLYTRQYMHQLFDLDPEDVPIDWAPDTFGHAVTMPTYLKQGGVKYLYLHRPGTRVPNPPRAFRWRAPDGSEILVKNDMECGYNGQITPAVADHLFRFSRETGLPFTVFVYGVGDHGGGPTRRDLQRIIEMNDWPVFPELRFSSAREFFERLDREGVALPVLDCELNDEFTGCYTTQTVIKKANRLAQDRLVDAETACALVAGACATDYNRDAFKQAWRDTLFSHFHDILPGSGVHDTRTYTHGLFQQCMAITTMEETKALRALGTLIDTSSLDTPAADVPPSRLPAALGSGVGFGAVNGALSAAEQSRGHGSRPFVIFNGLSNDRSDVVEVTVWDDACRADAWQWREQALQHTPFAVTGPDGGTVAAQITQVGDYWGHRYVRLAFPARVPGTGYAVYTVTEKASEPAGEPARQVGPVHHCPYAQCERSPEGLENQYLRLDLDPINGGILRLTEKASGVAVLDETRPSAILDYAVERPHGMSAWHVDHTGPGQAPVVTHIRRTTTGPYKASIDVDLRVAESEFTLTYELRMGDPNLYVSLRGTWFQRGNPTMGIPVLNLRLNTALDRCRATYDIPFGAIERQTVAGEEVPALQWADLNGTLGGVQAGIALINDSKHGYSLNGSALALTLIRASYDPDPLPEIGQHDMRFAIRPHTGRPPKHDLIRAADAFNRPLRIMGTDIHEGSLPLGGSFAGIDAGTAVLCGLKMAEDSDAVVLRFFNPEDTDTTVEVTLAPTAEEGEMTWQALDLMERPAPDTAVTVDGTRASVIVPAHGIVSIQGRSCS